MDRQYIGALMSAMADGIAVGHAAYLIHITCVTVTIPNS
jgi:hypothetical protein